MSFREEQIGRARLICADCRDVLPTLGKVDAVVTDPPYGLGERLLAGEGSEWGGFERALPWDTETADAALAQSLAGAAQQIIWGGNYYTLPPKRGWLLWDKMSTGFSSGDAEMAWTNIDIPTRTFRMARAAAYHSSTIGSIDQKLHPTQKPLRLMKWCLGFLPDAQTILDPFMGSGTTGVAAVQMGRNFIGVEREERYFDIACRRIEEAQKQGDLFIAA